MTELEELYLSHNGLTTIEGLSENVCPFLLINRLGAKFVTLLVQKKLTTLDIGNNKITSVPAEAISHLSELEEFWVSTIRYSAVFY